MKPISTYCREFFAVNNQIRLFDRYLSKRLHNPIVGAVCIIGCVSVLNMTQIVRINASHNWQFVFINDYFADILSNLINLVFVYRFAVSTNTASTNVYIESALFLCQNIGCYNLLFNSTYSLLYTDINRVFKLFITWQNCCPYVILMMNLFDFAIKRHRQSTEKQDTEKQDISSGEIDWLSFLVDSNNNFLPIFIAHSYIMINFSFPFAAASDSWLQYVVLLYKLYSFSFKFFCIYQFILYELALVFYASTHVYDYSVFYTSVSLNKETRPASNIYNNHKHHFMVAASLVVMAFDLVYIVMYYTS